jgi:phospholipase C
MLNSFILLTPYLQYFGTMAGVRGFNDPNVQVNPDGNSVWHQ